jgi:PST family polysaccharide transporter
LGLPLQFLGTVASARLARVLDFRRSAIIELLAQIAYYLIAIPLALSGLGAWSLVSAWVVQQLVSCVLFHAASRYVFRPAWDSSLIAAMVAYGMQFSIANAWSQLRLLVNPLIVGHFLDAEAVGFVALTARLVETLAVIRTITFRISFAAFGRLQHDHARLVRAMTEAIQLQTLAIAPLLLAFSWFGGLVLIPLVGDRWSPVISLFPYVALGNLALAQFNTHISALHVVNHSLQVSMFSSLSLLLFALGCAATVTQAGIIGYGYGELISLPSCFLLHVFVVRHIGRPDYQVAFIWLFGSAFGLFWHELGWWAILAPFIALIFPASIRQIRSFVSIIWRNGGDR